MSYSGIPSPAPKDFKMRSSQSIAWSTVKLMTSLDGPAVAFIGTTIFTGAVMGWKRQMVHSGVSWYITVRLVSWGHLIPIRWGFSETGRWSSENYLLMTAEYVFFVTCLRRYAPPLCCWWPKWSLMCSPAYPVKKGVAMLEEKGDTSPFLLQNNQRSVAMSGSCLLTCRIT